MEPIQPETAPIRRDNFRVISTSLKLARDHYTLEYSVGNFAHNLEPTGISLSTLGELRSHFVTANKAAIDAAKRTGAARLALGRGRPMVQEDIL